MKSLTAPCLAWSQSWRCRGNCVVVHYITALHFSHYSCLSLISATRTKVYKLSTTNHTCINAPREQTKHCSQCHTAAALAAAVLRYLRHVWNHLVQHEKLPYVSIRHSAAACVDERHLSHTELLSYTNVCTVTDWGVCSRPWQLFAIRKTDRPFFVTSDRCIPS
jgi:hypothetical protein